MLKRILPGWTINRAEDDVVLVVAPNGNGSHIQNKGSLANRILFQLANAIIDATSQKEKTEALRSCQFNFARTEDGAVTTLGILTFTTSIDNNDAAWAAMMDAITKWVATTDAGRSLWEYSSNDLNIGDLAGSDAFGNKDLKALLEARGLHFKSLAVSDSEGCADFDFALADATQIPSEDDAIESIPKG